MPFVAARFMYLLSHSWGIGRSKRPATAIFARQVLSQAAEPSSHTSEDRLPNPEAVALGFCELQKRPDHLSFSDSNSPHSIMFSGVAIIGVNRPDSPFAFSKLRQSS